MPQPTHLIRAFVSFIFVLLCSPIVYGGAVYTNLLTMRENVREQIKLKSIEAVPDSALTDFCNRGLLWTSVDIGGVMMRYKFNTADLKAFYQIPDSVVEILSATLITGQTTKSLKAFYPQFYEEINQITTLQPGVTDAIDPDIVPTGYMVWDDTLQLIPIPVKIDSIYLYCFIEHRTLAADSSAIDMKEAYREAALMYTCYLVMSSLSMYEEAGVYLAMYEKARAELREKYRPKFDILPGQKQ